MIRSDDITTTLPRRTPRLPLAWAAVLPLLAGAFLVAPGQQADPANAPATAASAPAERATSPGEPNATPPDQAAAPHGAEEPADLVGAVLSFDPVEEHTRFLVACGRGKELTAAAFAENRKHRNSFARPFDRWANLLLFDRDGSGTISWEEASRYRRALQKAVLAAYGADRDGQLSAENLAAANKALWEGRLPPLEADANPTSQSRPAAESQPASAPARSAGGDEETGGAEDADSADPSQGGPGAAPDSQPADPQE